MNKQLNAGNVATFLVLGIIIAWFLSFTLFRGPVELSLKEHENAMIQKYCMTGDKIDTSRKSCNKWVMGESQD
ncbi:hypothetical protein [Burkholderia phage FLC6]|nr:hypothetical protein [Burkholderia phage FLC6]